MSIRHSQLRSFFFTSLAMMMLFLSSLSMAMPPTPVNVVAAKMTEVFPTSWVSGSVISNNDAQIAAQVAGRLIEVAQVGDKVKQNDVIARIDSRDIELQIQQLEANVASRKRNYLFLKKEVVRLEGLAKRNLSAKTDLDKTIADRDIAQSDLAQAKAQLAQTQQRLTYTKIKAPFDGVVTKRLSQLGEVVGSDTGIIQLVETVNLEVTAQVPLTVYQYLKIDSMLEVDSPLGSTEAKIRAVVPVADKRSHLMELRLSLVDNMWPVGLNVRVAVPKGESQALLVVPRDAIVLRREGNAVFRISDNKAERISVELGLASGTVIAVSGDIASGDQVVIRGAERLQPGQAVMIKDNNDKLVSAY